MQLLGRPATYKMNLFILFTVMGSLPIILAQVRCSSGWKHFAHNRYCVFNSVQLPWEDAKATCEGMGSHLAIIRNSSEQSSITEIASDGNIYWIGLSKPRDVTIDTEWRWVDGSKLSYTNWLDRRPYTISELPDEDCVHIHPKQSLGRWNDLSCQNELRFICEIKSSSNGNCKHGLWNLVRYCYIYSSNQRMWHQARDDCIKLGGQLAIIRDYYQQMSITDNMPGEYSYWIGLSDINIENSFQWVDKTQLSGKMWASNQPDNYKHTYDCGFFVKELDNQTANTKWVDEKCLTRLDFICQKTVSNLARTNASRDVMLLSDTWHSPAVVHLLPFSPNSACSSKTHNHRTFSALNPTPHSPNPKIPALSPTNHPGVLSSKLEQQNMPLPALAIRRTGGSLADKEDYSLPRDHHVRTSCADQSILARATSERLTQSETSLDSSCGVRDNRRSMSECQERSSESTGCSEKDKPKGNSNASRGSQSSDQPTQFMKDANQGNVPRLKSEADHLTQLAFTTENSKTGSFLEKVPFPTTAAVSPDYKAKDSGGTDCEIPRQLLSKVGLWRAVTLTPGEQDLQRHRDQTHRTSGGKNTLSVDRMDSQHYRKMNIRDLPRCRTPAGDPDPDKLNMKQVIAYLQSKSQNQAAVAEMLRDGQTNICFPPTLKSGVTRSMVHRYTPVCTASETHRRSSGRVHQRASERQSSQATDSCSHCTSLPTQTTAARSRQAVSTFSCLTQDFGFVNTRNSSRWRRRSKGKEKRSQQQTETVRQQKRPFRLHRFLSMVPSVRDPTHPTSLSNSNYPIHSAAEADKDPYKAPTKELSPKPGKQEISQKEREMLVGKSAGAVVQGTSESRVPYRVSSAISTLTALRVHHNSGEFVSKHSHHLEGRHRSGEATASADVHSTDSVVQKERNVIRLPRVMHDTEEDDNDNPGCERSAKCELSESVYNRNSGHLNEENAERLTKDHNVYEEQNYSFRTTNEREHATPNKSSQLPATSLFLQVLSRSAGNLLGTSPCVPLTDQMFDNPINIRLPEAASPGGHLDVVTDSISALDVGNKSNKKVTVTIPLADHPDVAGEDNQWQKSTEYVTLSLRKEPHRTRETTYMSEISKNGSACSRKTSCDNFGGSLKEEDKLSKVSSVC